MFECWVLAENRLWETLNFIRLFATVIISSVNFTRKSVLIGLIVINKSSIIT